jgi:hypothetical protein
MNSCPEAPARIRGIVTELSNHREGGGRQGSERPVADGWAYRKAVPGFANLALSRPDASSANGDYQGGFRGRGSAGHLISVGQYSCRMRSGPMDGAVVTGDVIDEWDKANGVEVLGYAVVRKPGGFGVHQGTEGKVALTITDGKSHWSDGQRKSPLGHCDA